jgi:hypothetical protein
MDLLLRPEEIVVGEADTVKLCLFSFINEVVDSSETVI